MKRSQKNPAHVAAAVMVVAGLVAVAGCGQILGLDGYEVTEGAAAGGARVCTPGTTRDCYAGPAGTEGVGICKAGKETCNEEGTAYGACEGEVLPQQEICGQAADEDCSGYDCSQLMWGRVIDGGGAEGAIAVALDAAGNTFVAGTFNVNVDFGGAPLISAGGADVYLVKLAPDGSHQWSKRFGDAKSQSASALAVAPNGDVVMVGQFEGTVNFGGDLLLSNGEDFYVTRFNTEGEHIWSHTFGDPQVQAVDDVIVDSEGHVVLGGTYEGTLAFSGLAPLVNSGSSDVFVAKLDGGAGSAIWAKGFGTAGVQFMTGVAVDSADSILVTGAFAGSIDFGAGAPLTELKADGIDVFVAKLDAQGGYAWSKRFGGMFNENGGDVAVDSLGNVIVSGAFEGSMTLEGSTLSSTGAGDSDMFVAKLSAQGAHVWSRKLGDKDFQPGCRVAVGSDQSVTLAGQFNGVIDLDGTLLTSAGNYDMFLAKLDAGGKALWGKRFGDVNDQYLTDVDVDQKTGSIALSGVLYQGSIDLGSGPIMGKLNDLVIARFAP